MSTTRQLVLGGLLGLVLPQGALGQDCPVRGSFRRVYAQDGTVSVCVPSSGWQAGGVFEVFKALSDRGETFTSTKQDVYPSTQCALWAAQQIPQGIYRPEELAIMVRLASQPVGPFDLVRWVYPRLAPNAIRDTRVSGVALVPPGPIGIALVHYQYTLLPRQDVLLASLLNRALLQAERVEMEGAGLIVTLPQGLNPALVSGSPEVACVNLWGFVAVTVEAPRSLFGANANVYKQIFATYQIDFNRLQAKFAQQLQQFAQMQDVTHKVGEGWMDALSPFERYKDPSDPTWEGWGNPVPSGYQAWRCPAWGSTPILQSLNDPRPGVSCTAVVPK